jgi:hypothetical protein
MARDSKARVIHGTEQVDGDHYQDDVEQHWDRVWRLSGRGYFVGCITKYVERYPKKNGLTDLYKARTFLNKLIYLEEQVRDPEITNPLDPKPKDYDAEAGAGYTNQ